ncbi:MAG: beta-propeller fold lactonase family protein [Verrucomicrobiota bacterium]
MKFKIQGVVWVFLGVFGLCDVLRGEQCLYLSAGGTITVRSIHPASGELSLLQTVELPGAGPMVSSRDRTTLYVSSRMGTGKDDPGAIATFSLDEAGELTLLQQAPVKHTAGFLALDARENYLAGNNYGAGTLSVWALDRGVYQGETLQEVILEPKAHAAVFSPDNRFLLVPATGPNKVFLSKFEEERGQIMSNDPAFVAGPQKAEEAQQPRHLLFHPELPVIYSTNERLLPGLGVWRYEVADGNFTMEPIQNLVTNPEGYGGTITTATLRLTPDGKFLYLSNRDITDRNGPEGEDSIVCFSIDAETGRAELVGHTPCGRHPRSFDLDESGQFLFVAGQVDASLGAFRREADGSLTPIGEYEVGQRPSWVLCLYPPTGGKK